MRFIINHVKLIKNYVKFYKFIVVFFFKRTSYYFKCPLDNTSANEVFQDNALRREVLSLKVDCTNKSKCSWTGELRDLEVNIYFFYIKL